MKKYASFLAAPQEGVTTFDALNVMLEEGWRVERLDVITHERCVTYAFLLTCEQDVQEGVDLLKGEGHLEIEEVIFEGEEHDDEDDVEGEDEDEEDEAEALSRDIEWEKYKERALVVGIDERFLSEEASVLRRQLLTRTQESFLILRSLWQSARFLKDEAGALKSALEIQKLLGAHDADARWYAYLKSRAANPDDVDLLQQLDRSSITYKYPGALSTIEEAILKGESSNFSLMRNAIVLSDDVEEAPTMMAKRAKWAQASIEARRAPMDDEMVEAFKRDINWEQNQHLPRAQMLRDEHFRAPALSLDRDKSAREAPLDFIFARQRWQAARALGSEWDMRYQALLARRWLGEDVAHEYARMERARRKALKLDAPLLLEDLS